MPLEERPVRELLVDEAARPDFALGGAESRGALEVGGERRGLAVFEVEQHVEELLVRVRGLALGEDAAGDDARLVAEDEGGPGVADAFGERVDAVALRALLRPVCRFDQFLLVVFAERDPGVELAEDRDLALERPFAVVGQHVGEEAGEGWVFDG